MLFITLINRLTFDTMGMYVPSQTMDWCIQYEKHGHILDDSLLNLFSQNLMWYLNLLLIHPLFHRRLTMFGILSIIWHGQLFPTFIFSLQLLDQLHLPEWKAKTLQGFLDWCLTLFLFWFDIFTRKFQALITP